MNITIAMLLEALKEVPVSQVHAQERDQLSSIRVLQENQSMEKGILYLSQCTDASQVKCETLNGTSFYAQTNLFSLLNKTLEVLESYRDWQLRMLKAVEGGCTLTELLNLSYPIISHPLCILDANEWEIAHSELAFQEEIDADWSDLIEKHTSDTDKISSFNSLYYKYFNLRHVYRIPGDIFGPGYACNLFHHNSFCGVMVMADPWPQTPVTQGELDTLQYLRDLISDMIALNSFDVSLQLPHKPLFDYLAKGDTQSLEQLERSLEISLWKPDDPKQVIYAQALYSSHLAPMPSHSKLIFNHIPGLVTAEYRTGLVFLCNLRIFKSKHQANQVLSEHLRQISYYAGASSEFYTLTSMKKMLEQAQISLASSRQTTGYIHPFEDSITEYLFSVLKSLDQGLLAHPALEKLQTYDKRYGSKLYETFYIYLKNERKISKTLAELNVPRSTLLNRLHRMQELLDLPLDQPQVRLHLLLSYLLYSPEDF